MRIGESMFGMTANGIVADDGAIHRIVEVQMHISKMHQLGRAFVDTDILCLVIKLIDILKGLNHLLIDYVADLCLYIQFGVKSFRTKRLAEPSCLQYSSESHRDGEWSELTCHLLA